MPQNFAEFFPTPFSHSMPTGWAKNETVLFNCLNVVVLLLLFTVFLVICIPFVNVYFINKKRWKIKKTLKTLKKRDQHEKNVKTFFDIYGLNRYGAEHFEV